MLVRQETRRLGDGDAVMGRRPPSAGIPLELSLQLVTAYEAICEEEAARLDTLLSHSSAGDAAPALAAEREVLRGERNSWNPLRWLYHDWTAGRQAAPPPSPSRPPTGRARCASSGRSRAAGVVAKPDAGRAERRAGGGGPRVRLARRSGAGGGHPGGRPAARPQARAVACSRASPPTRCAPRGTPPPTPTPATPPS